MFFFQFKMIINVFVSSFWLIRIPMFVGLRPLQFLYYFIAGTVSIMSIRRNLTSADVIFWRLKSFPALWGLTRQNTLLLIKDVSGHCATSITMLMSWRQIPGVSSDKYQWEYPTYHTVWFFLRGGLDYMKFWREGYFFLNITMWEYERLTLYQ